MNSSEDHILQFVHVTKRFPGVLALDDVSFSVLKGVVHALVGENGAGKSTLIKIITGVYQKTSGEILYQGKPVAFMNPHNALKNGIAAIYQELNLIPALTVAENIFMGHHFRTERNFIDWKKIWDESQKFIDFLEVDVDIHAKVNTLGVAKKQVVEIAKALSLNAQVLIMDEPTAALAQKEIKTLFRIIRFLREKGVTILYISHHLEEIFEISDRVTVLRDGKQVITTDTKDLTIEDLIRMMVGRNLVEKFPREPHEAQEEVLRVEGFNRKDILHHISFRVKKGEIVGIAGMVGSGILLLSVMNNLGLPLLPKISHRGFVDDSELTRVSNEMVKVMNIKTPSLSQQVMYLSGGNQQKVVLGKWFARKCDIYLFDEPTRGVDVGAKVEIYHLMNKLIENGASIVMVSSELLEILGMSDRIIVMKEGRITGELSRDRAKQEEVLRLAIGGNNLNELSR
ncbi:MAG: sugar ABC transporter ATP-binding protein [Candidatus Atribacteria bacterium]|nr:sugar ABC transporter ATP-binding protein [Candidatus Atribacteria bacterium]